MSAGHVIVGAGEAGTRAAFALREQGYEGPVTLIGAEDVLPYERPPLSKRAITGDEFKIPFITGDERLATANIRFRPGTTVEAIDRPARTLRLHGGETIPYDRLLLTTGATARRLVAPDIDETVVDYLRTCEDSRRLRDKMTAGATIAIIGGGFIGLELAASGVQRGCTVTVIELAPRILMRGVPAEVAESIAARHALAGVRIQCGQQVQAVTARDGGASVALGDGTVIEADMVVAGIGAVPDTALAESAGLEIENGIKVDAYLTTSDPNILAAGDCCSFPHPLYDGRRIRLEAWRNAQDQGNLVARNMLGAQETHSAVPWFWSDQYELTLQIAGLTDAGSNVVVRALRDDTPLRFFLDDDGRLVAACAFGPNATIAKEIRLAEMLIARRAHPPPGQPSRPAAGERCARSASRRGGSPWRSSRSDRRRRRRPGGRRRR